MCFVVDLLQWVVVSSTVSSFMGFRVDILDDKVKTDRVIKSNHVHRCKSEILGILGIFFIIKCVDL